MNGSNHILLYEKTLNVFLLIKPGISYSIILYYFDRFSCMTRKDIRDVMLMAIPVYHHFYTKWIKFDKRRNKFDKCNCEDSYFSIVCLCLFLFVRVLWNSSIHPWIISAFSYDDFYYEAASLQNESFTSSPTLKLFYLTNAMFMNTLVQ